MLTAHHFSLWEAWVCKRAVSAGTHIWSKQEAVGHYQRDNIVSGWCKLQGDIVNRHGWVAAVCRGRDTDKWNIFGGLNRRKWGSVWWWHAHPPAPMAAKKKTDCLGRSLNLSSFNLAPSVPKHTLIHNCFFLRCQQNEVWDGKTHSSVSLNREIKTLHALFHIHSIQKKIVLLRNIFSHTWWGEKQPFLS